MSMTFLRPTRRSIDYRLSTLLVFYFLYRFVNVGFNAIAVYQAYSIVHGIWGSALAVLILTFGASIGLAFTGLYVLYRVRPQVLVLVLMMFRGVLLFAMAFLAVITESLAALLLVLVLYSAALWIERSIIGGIAIENVPSIARGLNALSLASRLGGLLAAACLVLLLDVKALAFAVLALLHAVLVVIMYLLVLGGRLRFRITVPRRSSMKIVLGGEAATLYSLMFILNIPLAVLSSIAPSFGATVYALFYTASEAATVLGQVLFIVIGDRVVLSSRMLFYGSILGLLLALVAYVYDVSSMLIVGVITICFTSTAGTVYVGNAIKYVFTDAIYNVKSILSVASLLGAMLGSVILLTPVPSIVLTLTSLAVLLNSPVIYRGVKRVETEILQCMRAR